MASDRIRVWRTLRPTSSSSSTVQLKQPRPFPKLEMARRNQAGQHRTCSPRDTLGEARWRLIPCGSLLTMSNLLLIPHRPSSARAGIDLDAQAPSAATFPSRASICEQPAQFRRDRTRTKACHCLIRPICDRGTLGTTPHNSVDRCA